MIILEEYEPFEVVNIGHFCCINNHMLEAAFIKDDKLYIESVAYADAKKFVMRWRFSDKKALNNYIPKIARKVMEDGIALFADRIQLPSMSGSVSEIEGFRMIYDPELHSF